MVIHVGFFCSKIRGHKGTPILYSEAVYNYFNLTLKFTPEDL